MTNKEIKIEKRNELLKAFNSNAINTETLGGLGTTFNFKKKTVTLTENGISKIFKTNEVTLENQTIFYILK